MSTASNALLLTVGILAPLICVGLVFYMNISASRSEEATLRATTAAFRKLLSERGKSI